MSPARRPRLRGWVAVALAAAVASVAAIGLVLLLRDDKRPAPVFRPIGTALAGAAPAAANFPGLTETRLAVGSRCLRLVVADDLDERVAGLQGRDALGRYDGMLFVFDVDSTSAFTMEDVPVPLDIGWYGASGRPLDRAEMEPCPQGLDCPRYRSASPFRFALETLRGGLPAGALEACP